MTLRYVQQKGSAIWHATEATSPTPRYTTLCGQMLDHRHLGAGLTTDEPRLIANYCRECWEVEANNT